MIYFLYYLIFCSSTAITCWLVLYLPALKELQKQSVNHVLVSRKYIGYFSILMCFLVAAPVLIFVLFNNRSVEIFRDGLLKSFLS